MVARKQYVEAPPTRLRARPLKKSAAINVAQGADRCTQTIEAGAAQSIGPGSRVPGCRERKHRRAWRSTGHLWAYELVSPLEKLADP